MAGLDLNPPWVEGIRNTTYDLSVELANRGHEVHFLTKGYYFHKEVEHFESGITFHRIITEEGSGYLKGFQGFFFGLPNALFELIKEFKLDVIHTHSSYPLFGWYVGMVAMLIHCKRFFSLYSSNISAPTFEYSSILMRGLKLAKSHNFLRMGNIDATIVSSRKAFIDLVNRGLCKRNIHYVPIGVDTNRFKPKRIHESDLRDELNISNDTHVILFAGDLTPYKGIENFLFSLKKLKRAHKDFVGLILTKGLYEKESSRRQLVRQLVTQLDLSENIRLCGVRNDIESVYNLSDIVVFPFSRNYALMDTPRALLEAMACGRPVVATRVSAIPEVIEHGQNGMLVEPDNESELREALEFVLKNEGEAEELGENAAKFILKKHRLSIMASKVEQVYGMHDQVF